MARQKPMTFYLGTHEVAWLDKADVPLFVSHVRLRDRKRLPVAAEVWALDSGAFSELTKHGRWVTTLNEYVESVQRYQHEVRSMMWAAPMDWMCEPFMVERTGLSVREHQERTVQNYLDLRESMYLPPFIPVLQGWTLDDYVRCVELYESAGVRLERLPLVGLGSVCRRQATGEIDHIIRTLASMLQLHGFGCKVAGLTRYAAYLRSADSMAWSFRARRSPAMQGCTHTSCANCIRYALAWRQKVLRRCTVHQDQLWEVA